MNLKPVILFLFICTISRAPAHAATACTDTRDPESIMRFLACQSQPGLFSCAEIGLGLGGPWLWRQDPAKTAASIIRARVQMLATEKQAVTTELAAEAFEQMQSQTLRAIPKDAEGEYQKFLARQIHPKADPVQAAFYKSLAKLKPPRFWPQVEEIGGTYYDVANTEFKKLPLGYQSKYLAKAKSVVDQVFDRGLGQGEFDQTFFNQVEQAIHTRYYQAMAPSSPAAVKAGNLHPQIALSKMRDSFCRDCARKAVVAYQTALEAASRAPHAGDFETLKKTGPAGVFMAARVNGLALTSSLGDLRAAPPGCGTDPTTANIATDEACKTMIAIDQRVLRFLQKPAAEQLELLKADPVVCDFYRELNRQVYGGHKFSSVSCGAGGYTFTTLSYGKARTHQVTLNKQGEIEKLHVQFTDSMFGPMADFKMAAGSMAVENSKDVSPAELLQMQRDLKLYLPASLGCCSKPPVEDLKSTCNGGNDNGFSVR